MAGRTGTSAAYDRVMPDVLDGLQATPFTSGTITHDVYRAGAGPAVVVIAELPGITPKVVAFARRVMDLGCSVALPHLFGSPGRPPSAAYGAQSFLQVCVAREFSCVALGQIGPVSGWLRALSKAEHERAGGPGVGVVGMCFTGNYALAMAVDDIVIAPVLSQPSLPFPVSGSRKADPAVSEADLASIKARTAGDGTRFLGLRFTGDKVCPPARFQRLRDESRRSVHLARVGLVEGQSPRPPGERPLGLNRAPRRPGGHADAGRPRPGAGPVPGPAPRHRWGLSGPGRPAHA